MNDLLRPATSPHSLLIGLKQAELLTNRFYKPFGQLSCPYFCSFKQISFLLVVFSLLLIDTGLETLCSLSRRLHNSTSFIECQLASRQNSAINHTLILEEIQIELSSHFTLLPYEIVHSTSDVVISYPLSPPPCYKRVINEPPRGDSLCNDDDVTWTCWTWTTVLLDATCSVITLTHVNYKLLVLYRICYRVYTRSSIINDMWKWTTLLASRHTR